MCAPALSCSLPPCYRSACCFNCCLSSIGFTHMLVMATMPMLLLLLVLLLLLLPPPIHQYHISFLTTDQAGICQSCLHYTMQPMATQGPDQCVFVCRRLVTPCSITYNFVILCGSSCMYHVAIQLILVAQSPFERTTTASVLAKSVHSHCMAWR